MRTSGGHMTLWEWCMGLVERQSWSVGYYEVHMDEGILEDSEVRIGGEIRMKLNLLDQNEEWTQVPKIS